LSLLTLTSLKKLKIDALMSITDMDLADICLKGLRSSIRDRIEGSDFLSVVQVQVRALIIENRMNKDKDNFKSHRSNVHIIDYDSDSSNDSDKKFMLLNLFGPLKKNLILVHLLSRLIKVGKKKLNLLLMFPSVITYLMNCLNLEISNLLILFLHLKN
jgi:hypothetical protein